MSEFSSCGTCETPILKRNNLTVWFYCGNNAMSKGFCSLCVSELIRFCVYKWFIFLQIVPVFLTVFSLLMMFFVYLFNFFMLYEGYKCIFPTVNKTKKKGREVVQNMLRWNETKETFYDQLLLFAPWLMCFSKVV